MLLQRLHLLLALVVHQAEAPLVIVNLFKRGVESVLWYHFAVAFIFFISPMNLWGLGVHGCECARMGRVKTHFGVQIERVSDERMGLPYLRCVLAQVFLPTVSFPKAVGGKACPSSTMVDGQQIGSAAFPGPTPQRSHRGAGRWNLRCSVVHFRIGRRRSARLWRRLRGSHATVGIQQILPHLVELLEERGVVLGVRIL